ncbi:hypothetical protein ACFL6L_01150 [candidate division KSB1 bacterium]
MKRLIRFSVVSLFLLSTASVYADLAAAQILEVELKEPELVFGAEFLPDEFLVVEMGTRPGQGDLAVDEKNNVYLYDEERIKVYDKNGKAKAIISGPGQGPGEFVNVGLNFWGRHITIGPEGYVTVLDKRRDLEYYVFDPSYHYVGSVFKRPQWSENNVYIRCRVVTFKENEHVGRVYDIIERNDFELTSLSLKHVKNDREAIFAHYETNRSILKGEVKVKIPYTGTLTWGVLPGRKICYTHTREDEHYEDGNSFYIIHVYDLDSGERREFRFPFDPIPWTDEDLKRRYEREKRTQAFARERLPDRRRQELPNTYEIRGNYLRENGIKNETALFYFVVDGSIGYAFTRNVIETGGRYDKCLVHVLDLEEGRLLRKVYFPSVGTEILYIIKNGCIFEKNINDEGFPVFHRYCIDPAIYEK